MGVDLKSVSLRDRSSQLVEGERVLTQFCVCLSRFLIECDSHLLVFWIRLRLSRHQLTVVDNSLNCVGVKLVSSIEYNKGMVDSLCAACVGVVWVGCLCLYECVFMLSQSRWAGEWRNNLLIVFLKSALPCQDQGEKMYRETGVVSWQLDCIRS